MPNNFPVISGLLREFVDYDIAGGLRQVFSDLRSGWSSPYDKLASSQKKRMTKLTPVEKTAVARLVKPVYAAKIKNPAQPMNVNVDAMVKQINSRQEAEALLGALKTIAVALKTINSTFIRNMTGAGYITQKEADQYLNNINAQTRIKLGPKVLGFIKEHEDKFMQMLDVDENLLVNTSGAAAVLRNAIEQTPEQGEEGRTRKDAILGVYYMLSSLAVGMNDAFDAVEHELRTSFAEKKPAAKPAGTKGTAPSDGTAPSEGTSPTTPTSP